MLRRVMTGAVSYALLLAALAGCESKTDDRFIPFEPTPTGSDTTLFLGFLADGVLSGELEVVIDSKSLAPALRSLAPGAPSPTVGAVGILKWPGGDLALTGAYDPTVDTLYLAGAGRELRGSFAGSGDKGILRGRATTPNGPAGFMAAHDSASAYRAWTGSFHSADLADSGTFCFVHAGDVLAGQAFQSGATAAMDFDGPVTNAGGSLRSLTFDGVLPTMFDVSGSGSLNESTGAAFGIYDFSVSNASYGTSSMGTWAATKH